MKRQHFVVEVVNHKKTHYKLVNVYFDEYQYTLKGVFFKISNDIALSLKDAIFLGKTVIVEKDKLESDNYTLDDFEIHEVNEFEVTKNSIIVKQKNTIGALMTMISFFDMYEFIAVTGQLASQGVFITDSNREETFLNIINTGDEDLIGALETYLEIKDTMDSVMKRYRRSATLLKAVEKAQDMEDLESIKKAWNVNEL
jgi:hypothetical protein